MNNLIIHEGHVLDVLRAMAADSVHCIVTSPPYWGLRDYKLEAQVWGGQAGCVHEWHTHVQVPRQIGWDSRRYTDNPGDGAGPVCAERHDTGGGTRARAAGGGGGVKPGVRETDRETVRGGDAGVAFGVTRLR